MLKIAKEALIGSLESSEGRCVCVMACCPGHMLRPVSHPGRGCPRPRCFRLQQPYSEMHPLRPPRPIQSYSKHAFPPARLSTSMRIRRRLSCTPCRVGTVCIFQFVGPVRVSPSDVASFRGGSGGVGGGGLANAVQNVRDVDEFDQGALSRESFVRGQGLGCRV